MLIFKYETKKQLKQNVGSCLKYQETSMFGNEYISTGQISGSNRPSILGIKAREFFAIVTMKDDVIVKVE